MTIKKKQMKIVPFLLVFFMLLGSTFTPYVQAQENDAEIYEDTTEETPSTEEDVTPSEEEDITPSEEEQTNPPVEEETGEEADTNNNTTNPILDTLDDAPLDWAFSVASKPLHDAILVAYPAIDSDRDGYISKSEAAAWSGTTISLANKGTALQGTLDGIQYFTNRVTNISLNGNRLSGPIPTDIGDIGKNGTGLATLNLSSNHNAATLDSGISGSIPTGIGSLTSLTSLSLNNNVLSGSIPTEIGNLTKLITLNLHSNYVSTVPGSGLSGDIPDFNANKKLSTLYLYSNQLSGLIPDLSGAEALTNVRIYSNQLTGFSSDFKLGPSVTTFYAHSNKLTGSMPKFNGATGLKDLQLYSNQLTGEIPAEIGDLISLITLRLDSNRLTGSIPKELGRLINLNTLRLGTNQLTGGIPSELGDLEVLTSLYLNNNNLSGSIPSKLGNLDKLTVLDFQGNQLTGVIPEKIGDLSLLTSLSLQANSLTGSIPESFGNLANLKTFRINSNYITGNLPDSMGNLDKLEEFTFSMNKITGPIPESYGNLISLKTLYARSNLLTGSIPESFGNLINLSTADFFNNKLTGQIPESFGNLANLSNLNLYNNEISGTIPESLGNLNKLWNLQMAQNQLTGSIPESFGNLVNLKQLDISYNHLTGEIPVALGGGNKTAYTFLRLNNNNLSGELPASFDDLTIEILNVSHNSNLLASTTPSNTTTFINIFTKGPTASLNRVSTVVRYSIDAPQDGDFMILNQDINGDGQPDLNIVLNGGEIPQRNIDVNGDKKADLYIGINGDFYNNHGFNQAVVVNSTAGGFLGWIPSDWKIVSDSISAQDVKLGDNPYYLIPADSSNPKIGINFKTVISPVTGETVNVYPSDVYPPNILELNKDNGDGTFSNIDLTGNGIPDLNITGQFNLGDLTGTDANGFPITNTSNSQVSNPTQSTDPLGINYLVPGSNPPQVNNADISGDGKPDYNIDFHGNGVPVFNVIQLDGSITNPVQSLDPNGLNYDRDGDGRPDTNIDLTGNGIADVNIDTTGNGFPDKNLTQNTDPHGLNYDSTGDGFPDLNIDVDGDRIADLNIDTTGDGVPNLNVVVNPDGTLKNPVLPTDKPNLNVVTNSDGTLKNPVLPTDVPNLNVVTDGKGNLKVPLNLPDDKANVNIDTTGNGLPDLNIDYDGDLIAHFNVIQSDGTLVNVVQSSDPYGLNYDATSNGRPDFNIDLTGDGVADINIVTNGELVLSGALSTIKVGEKFTVVPSIEDGEWKWDEEYFSATFNSPATFTALKEGKTIISYTVNGETVSFEIEIVAKEEIIVDEGNGNNNTANNPSIDANQPTSKTNTSDVAGFPWYIVMVGSMLTLVTLIIKNKKKES